MRLGSRSGHSQAANKPICRICDERKKMTGDSVAPLSSETMAINHLSIPECEQCSKWIRATFGRETIVDSTRAMILRRTNRLPIYCFPKEDVRVDLMEKSRNEAELRPQGTAFYWSLKVGIKNVENAAWSFPEATGEWEFLRNYILLEWGAMDAWFEEDEEVFVHLKDPYHRIDVLKSTRQVRVVVGGQTVAQSDRSFMLFETGFPTRYYIPKKDVSMQYCEPSNLMTRCPYKGIASSYWSIKVDDIVLENSVWSYGDPLPEAHKIKDCLCFYNEKVDAIYLDNELVPKPDTPWS